MNTYTKSTRFWHRKAAEVRRAINFGWSLTTFSKVFVFASIALGPLVMFLRWEAIDRTVLLLLAFALLLFTTLCSIHRARRKFITTKDAFILLDSTHALDTALSTAFEIDGGYPDPGLFRGSPLRWNLGSVALSCLVGLGLLSLAFLLPISQRKLHEPITPPPPLFEVEGWVEKLKESSEIDTRSMDELLSKLDQLKQTPREKWYDLSSLEAQQKLHDDTESSIASLNREIDNAISAVQELEAKGDSISKEALGSADARLNESLSSLSDPSKLALGEAEHFRNLKGQSASRQELARLRDTLQRARDKLRGITNEHDGKRSSASASNQKESGEQGEESDTTEGSPTNDRSRQSAPSDENGEGAPIRGPGEAPLNLSEKSPNLTSNRIEFLDQSGKGDADSSTLVTLVPHAPTPLAKERTGNEGAPNSRSQNIGREGSTWQETFTPDDKRILERYFK